MYEFALCLHAGSLPGHGFRNRLKCLSSGKRFETAWQVHQYKPLSEHVDHHELEDRLETGLLPWDIEMTVEESFSDDEDGV